jgi:hypothetical protein
VLHAGHCDPPGSKYYPSKPQLKARYTGWGIDIPEEFTVRDLLERNLVENSNFKDGEEVDNEKTLATARMDL